MAQSDVLEWLSLQREKSPGRFFSIRDVCRALPQFDYCTIRRDLARLYAFGFLDVKVTRKKGFIFNIERKYQFKTVKHGA